MKLQMVGCSHHNAPLEIRERLAFNPQQAAEALARWRRSSPTPRRCCSRPATASRSTPPAKTPRNARRIIRLRSFWPSSTGWTSSPCSTTSSSNRAKEWCGTCSPSPPASTAWSSASRKSWRRSSRPMSWPRPAIGRPPHSRNLSGGPARGQARGQRNGDQRAPRQHSQRGGGRFRPPDLRAVRRQARAGDRRRRNGRRDPALPARRGRPRHHGNQSQPCARGTARSRVRRSSRAVGKTR